MCYPVGDGGWSLLSVMWAYITTVGDFIISHTFAEVSNENSVAVTEDPHAHSRKLFAMSACCQRGSASSTKGTSWRTQ